MRIKYDSIQDVAGLISEMNKLKDEEAAHKEEVQAVINKLLSDFGDIITHEVNKLEEYNKALDDKLSEHLSLIKSIEQTLTEHLDKRTEIR